MIPPSQHYSPQLHTLIRRLSTPEKIQRWLASLDYNTEETMFGLPMVVKRKRAHCLEGAIAAAALLEPYGYPPLILDLESEDLLDHTLFVFQHNGKWGAIGKSRDIGLDGRKPVFKTIEALARSYVIPYIDAQAHIKRFGVLDLRILQSQRWKNSRRNVWYVEDALRKIPHQNIPTPPSIVRRWRKRYLVFKQRYPSRQPDYFPHQEQWW